MSVAATRYAQALYDSAASDGMVDQIQQELGNFVSVLNENSQLKTVLFQSRVSVDQKKAVFKDIFFDIYCLKMTKYLELLIERKRINIIHDIHTVFNEIVQVNKNILTAHVRTAKELTPVQEEALRAKLSSATGRNIKLVMEVDPSLIGGISVRLGDKLIDGSIRGYLERLGQYIGARHTS
jgi:F-type H+-transporting ATPase subunit delta